MFKPLTSAQSLENTPQKNNNNYSTPTKASLSVQDSYDDALATVIEREGHNSDQFMEQLATEVKKPFAYDVTNEAEDAADRKSHHA